MNSRASAATPHGTPNGSSHGTSSRTPHGPPPRAHPARVVSGDPDLIAALDRLGAAAGMTPEVVREVSAAGDWWRDAPVVLVGADLAGPLALHDVHRRPDVHVVALGKPPDGAFRDALALGAESVVVLPEADAWVVRTLADASEGLGPPARVVGVVGGSGGVGASTLAAALASALTGEAARGGGVDTRLGTVLVDADPLGGGVERLLGLDERERPAGERTDWGRIAETQGRLGAAALRRALPTSDGVGVLGWGSGRRAEVGAAVVRETLDAARRATGTVVVDLSRHPGEMTRELLHRCDDLVVVSGCTLPATAACAQLLTTHATPARTHLVVREQAGGLAAEDVAGALGVPLRAVLGRQKGLDELVGLGVGPAHAGRGPLRRAIRVLLAAITTDGTAA